MSHNATLHYAHSIALRHRHADALKAFTNMVHSAKDRCTICTFNKNLVYRQKLGHGIDWDDISASGNKETRLYDTICDVVDHLRDDGDSLHNWIIVVIVDNNDNISTRSADECKRYVLTKYASGMKNRYVFLVSVGNNVDCAQLDSLKIDECLYHIHIKRADNLETELIMKISLCGAMAGSTLAMDYVICVDDSALRSTQPSSRALPVQPAHKLEQELRPLLAQELPKLPPALPTQQLVLGLTAPPAMPETPPTKLPALPARPILPATIRMRQFSNKHLHPSDKNIFAKFATTYYPGIPTSWKEDDISFFILVESEKRSIVGMLVTRLHDNNRVHIRFMAVKPEYRKHGLGTNMLKYIASKYIDKTVTLNVAFDRLDLLNFYYDKGYVRFDEFSTKHKVIVFSLVHSQLISS